MPLLEVHTSFHLWKDREKDIVNNPLHRRLTFFDKNTNEQTLKNIIKTDTAIEKAQQEIRFVAQDKEMFRAYRMREMALSDLISGINNARREGIAIGNLKRSAIVAVNLRNDGFPIEKIADYTQLSVEDVIKTD
jgi:predicted transposase/invertase (TIGR01784 family)